MLERGHILKVLKRVKNSLEKENYIEIKQLSNRVIHKASIDQDPDIIALAVIIYSLSKLIEREDYRAEKNWEKFYQAYLKNIKDMVLALEEKDIHAFRDEINQNRILIQNLSGKLKTYISHVFKDARINKASRIYEHGISMEKTAKILGISIWELAEYAGKTGVANQNLGITLPIQKRVKITREIFECE